MESPLSKVGGIVLAAGLTALPTLWIASRIAPGRIPAWSYALAAIVALLGTLALLQDHVARGGEQEEPSSEGPPPAAKPPGLSDLEIHPGPSEPERNVRWSYQGSLDLEVKVNNPSQAGTFRAYLKDESLDLSGPYPRGDFQLAWDGDSEFDRFIREGGSAGLPVLTITRGDDQMSNPALLRFQQGPEIPLSVADVFPGRAITGVLVIHEPKRGSREYRFSLGFGAGRVDFFVVPA